MAQTDVYNAVQSAASSLGTAISEVKSLVDQIQKASGEDLQKLMARLQEKQQDVELRKQMEERLLKIAEINNQNPQPR